MAGHRPANMRRSSNTYTPRFLSCTSAMLFTHTRSINTNRCPTTLLQQSMCVCTSYVCMHVRWHLPETLNAVLTLGSVSTSAVSPLSLSVSPPPPLAVLNIIL